MSKLELQATRQNLIEELRDVTISANRRLEIQRQLSEVNAELKRINTNHADLAKAEADKRKERGLAEQAQNLARSGAKVPATQAAPTEHAPARAERKMSRGEFLLKNANQMLRKIESIREPLPFTTDFYNALTAYVAQQRVHLRDEARRTATDGGETDDPAHTWKETWKDAGVFRGIKPPSGTAA